MKGFSTAGQDICDAIESILNLPDDPTVKDGAFDTYDDDGLQSVRWLAFSIVFLRSFCLKSSRERKSEKIIQTPLLQVAKDLAESLNTASSLCQVNGLKLGRELWAPAMGVLERCQGLSFKSKGKDKCLVARYETLHALFRTGPGYGDKDAPTPPNLVAVCKAYATGPLKNEAASLLQVTFYSSTSQININSMYASNYSFCSFFSLWPCFSMSLCAVGKRWQSKSYGRGRPRHFCNDSSWRHDLGPILSYCSVDSLSKGPQSF